MPHTSHVAERPMRPMTASDPDPIPQDLLSLPPVTPTQRSAPGPQTRSPWSTFPSYTVYPIGCCPGYLTATVYCVSMSGVLLSILQDLV